jgi:hypothetical protein
MTDVTSLDDRQDPLLGLFDGEEWCSLARPWGPAWSSDCPRRSAEIPQPACPCRARTPNKHRLSLHSRAIAWMWWWAPMRSLARVQGRVEALLPQLEDTPDVAEVEDPDGRPDTFQPARRRHADSGPGQLVTQPIPKEYAHA